ncbi:MAG: cytochrome c-type biogenesis protein [Chloroflexota bacterium]
MKSSRFTLCEASRVRFAGVLFFFAALFLLVFSFAGSALAQTPAPVTDDDVNAVAREVYCPVCENVPLDVCPTKACADWREEIRLMLIGGKSEAEIRQYFIDRFGDRVVGMPPRRGLNWLVYLIPPLALVVGALLLFRIFKTRKKSSAGPGALPPPPAEDDYVRKLEEELKQRDT